MTCPSPTADMEQGRDVNPGGLAPLWAWTVEATLPSHPSAPPSPGLQLA